MSKSTPSDLMKWVYRRDRGAIGAYLKAGGSLEVLDEDGRTALYNAVVDAEGRPDVVHFLLDHRANPNVHDRKEQWTPLHAAAQEQDEQVAALLLKHGAEVDAQDVFGNTPLWRCIMSGRKLSLVRLFLDHGANPNQANNSGNSPRDMAIRLGEGEIAKLLAEG